MGSDPGGFSKKIGEPFLPLLRKYRQHWTHPAQTGQPYSVGEAFQDLWHETVTKPTVRHYKGHRVRLLPGELVTSQNDLAERWRWSRRAVRRLLNELHDNGELTSETSHHWTKLTLHAQARWWRERPTNGTTKRPTNGQQTANVYKRRLDVETEKKIDGCGQPVDKSMPRKVAEVVEAFQQVSGQIRAPSVREKVRVEAAITANGGDHVPIREHVRTVTARAISEGADPTSVCYGIAAWENNQRERESASRPANRREPEERPLRPASHEPFRPASTRELSDDEHEGAVESIGGILKRLTSRSGS